MCRCWLLFAKVKSLLKGLRILLLLLKTTDSGQKKCEEEKKERKVEYLEDGNYIALTITEHSESRTHEGSQIPNLATRARG